jgi:DNA-binding transcriptional ArsR family regulator
MLHALMDGRALTASELARVAGVTPQTASEHLAKLAAADLVQVEKQGRHRYHRLCRPALIGANVGRTWQAPWGGTVRRQLSRTLDTPYRKLARGHRYA